MGYKALLIVSLLVNTLVIAVLVASCFWKPTIELRPELELFPTSCPCEKCGAEMTRRWPTKYQAHNPRSLQHAIVRIIFDHDALRIRTRDSR